MKLPWIMALAVILPLGACEAPPSPLPPAPAVWNPGSPDTDPLDVAVWAQAGVPANEIGFWKRLGASPEDARYWSDQGVSPAQLIAYVSKDTPVSDYSAIQAAMHPPAPKRRRAVAALPPKHHKPVVQSIAPSPPSAADSSGSPNEDDSSQDDDGDYYTSSDGSEVHGPTSHPSAAYGHETAICEDGTHSYSHHHRGTCSHHGGVADWED